MMHPRVYTDVQLILHFSPIKSAFPQTSESSVSAVTVEVAHVCPEPQSWLFTFSYKQHSWGSSWWPLPGWLMTYTLQCVGGSGPHPSATVWVASAGSIWRNKGLSNQPTQYGDTGFLSAPLHGFLSTPRLSVSYNFPPKSMGTYSLFPWSGPWPNTFLRELA